MQPNESSPDRAAAETAVVAGYEALMRRVAGMHAPEFAEVDITMPQAKTLYVVGASGEIHMSALVARLGVSLSTVSGLVDRLVDAGFATRHDDPADRRQVVVAVTPSGIDFLDRFRELGSGQLRRLLRVLELEELAAIERALASLTRAAEAVDRADAADLPAIPAIPPAPSIARKDHA